VSKTLREMIQERALEPLASVVVILIVAMLAKEGHGMWALAGVLVLYPACFTLQWGWPFARQSG